MPVTHPVGLFVLRPALSTRAVTVERVRRATKDDDRDEIVQAISALRAALRRRTLSRRDRQWALRELQQLDRGDYSKQGFPPGVGMPYGVFFKRRGRRSGRSASREIIVRRVHVTDPPNQAIEAIGHARQAVVDGILKPKQRAMIREDLTQLDKGAYTDVGFAPGTGR